jgi:TP901 family phage tail tape measure protein
MPIGKLLIQFGADFKEVKNAIATIESDVSKFSRSIGSLGKVALTGVSAAAILDIGKNALISAAKYETAFLRIKNITDASTKDIELYKSSLGRISSEVGRPIQELTQSLYSINSAGLTGKRALETLEIAAKASAVGLGDVDTIAKSITASINAYGSANLTASQAASILFNTTKLGAIDIADLAPAMGQVIPIASSMGVSLGQVGGAIAAMSLQGINASEAVTSLVSIMNAMLKPSAEAEKLLAGVGLSMDKVRAVARNDFAGAIKLVSDAFKGNEGAISQVLGRVEALKGFLAISGNNFQRYSEIVKQTSTDMQSFGNASDEALQSTEVKWAKIVTNVKNRSLEAGGLFKTLIVGISNAMDALEAKTFTFFGGVAQSQPFTNILSTIDAIRKSTGTTLGNSLNPANSKPYVAPDKDKIITPGGKELTILEQLNKKYNDTLDLITKIDQKQGNTIALKENLLKIETQIRDITAERKALEDSITSKLLTQQKLSVTTLPTNVGEVKSNTATGPLGSKVNTNDIVSLGEKIQANTQYTKDFNKETIASSTTIQALASFAGTAFEGLGAGLIQGASAFKTLGLAALDAAGQIVNAALAAAIAQAIAGSLKNSFNIIAGLALAAIAIGAVKALFAANVPKLAKGGITTGPTYALIGDNPGGREVVQPLSALLSMVTSVVSRQFDRAFSGLGAIVSQLQTPIQPTLSSGFATAPIQVDVTGSIRGNDIVLLNNRIGNTQNRLRGSKS